VETGNASSPESGVILAQQWPGLSGTEKIARLRSLTPADYVQLLSHAADLVKSEHDPEVVKTWIALLPADLPEERLTAFELFLIAPDPLLCVPALDMFVNRAPHRLGRFLPRLLLSEHLRVRFLSLKALAAIDPQESARHLEFLLMSEKVDDVLGALNACLVSLPELVRDPLLKFLTVTENPECIQRAGLFFQVNPDPHVPFRLYELMEKSSTAKAACLRPVLGDALKALADSEILGADFPAYKTRLKTWAEFRQAQRRVANTLFGFLQDPSPDQQEIVAALAALFENPLQRNIAEQAQRWEIPDRAKDWLRQALALVVTAPDDAPAARFSESSEDEKIRFLASWKPTAPETARVFLHELAVNAGHSEDLRAMALRTALRVQIDIGRDEFLVLLNHHHELLRTSAFEYAVHFVPEQVQPLLGIFLKSPQIRIKTKAINALARFDLPQAVSILMTLLRTSRDNDRQAVMNCLVQFDFSLIREPLTDFLLRSSSRAWVPHCLFLFQANPDPENLFCLFRLEKALSGQLAEQVKATSREIATLLVELERVSSEQVAELLAGLPRRWEQETLAATTARPEYAVSRLHPKAAGYFRGEAASSFDIADLPWKSATALVLTIGAAAWLFLAPEFDRPQPRFDASQSRAFDWAPGIPAPGTALTAPITASFAPPRTVTEEFTDAAELVRNSLERPPEPPFGNPEMQLIAKASTNPALARGLAALETGDLAEAGRALEAALRDDPDNPFLGVSVFSALFELAQRQGDEVAIKKAEQQFLAALGKLPFEYGTVYFAHMARTHSLFEQLTENLAVLRLKAGTLPPHQADLLTGLDNARLNTGFESLKTQVPRPPQPSGETP
jgi:tetratricopeptide (TPR) repeat protein